MKKISDFFFGRITNLIVIYVYRHVIFMHGDIHPRYKGRMQIKRTREDQYDKNKLYSYQNFNIVE